MLSAQLDHLHLACQNLKVSEAFYRRYFDAEVIARYTWRDVHTVAVRIGGTRFNLTAGTSPRPVNHIGLALPGLGPVFERMERDGVVVKRPPHIWKPEHIEFVQSGMSLTARFAFVDGPDGEVLELVDRSADLDA